MILIALIGRMGKVVVTTKDMIMGTRQQTKFLTARESKRMGE
jgi:hypothetical protein